MIRVGHVVTNLWDGGIERVVHQICAGLPNDQFECTVYALLPENPWEDVFKSSNVRVRSYCARNRGGLIGTLRQNLTCIFLLARDLRNDRIDVVNTHDFFPGVLGRLAAIFANVPRVYTTLHNTYSWLDWRHGLVNRMLMLGTDGVIGVSNACIADSMKRDHLPEHSYRVIPNGVDAQRFHPRPEARAKLLDEVSWPSDAFVIGNIGTISSRKSQITLVKAFSRISSECPNARLLIVGSERPHELEVARELYAAVNQLPDPSRVKFLKDRNDIEHLLAGLDLFCMPSKVEGFGIALVEAMLCGIPVVVSDIPAFREVLGQNSTEEIFHQAGNDNALGNILRRLYLVPEDRYLISELGLERAAEFSETKMLQRYFTLYSDEHSSNISPTNLK